MQALPTLSFASFYVARDMGFFDYQGVKFDLTLLQSGATAQQAMVSGTVDMTIGGAQEVAAAVAKNIDLYAIVDVANQTLEVCARQDLMKQKGVTAASPLKDRLAALKGSAIGITAPGAASDRTMRWLLQKYGGLDPNTDVQMINVNGASAMSAAFEQNRVQAFLLSPPYCELAEANGTGTVLIKPSDVPEFKNFVLQVIYSTKSWVEKNPEAARRVATGIAMGDNFLLKYPDASIQILQREFKDVDPKIVDQAVRQTILPQIVPDGKMSEDLWKNTNTILLESGLVETPVDTKEGVMWTNQYIGDATVP